jgi:hypothetical protein
VCFLDRYLAMRLCCPTVARASYSCRGVDRRVVSRHDGDRHILYRRLAPRALDLYQDRVSLFRTLAVPVYPFVQFFILNCIARHQSCRSH